MPIDGDRTGAFCAAQCDKKMRRNDTLVTTQQSALFYCGLSARRVNQFLPAARKVEMASSSGRVTGSRLFAKGEIRPLSHFHLFLIEGSFKSVKCCQFKRFRVLFRAFPRFRRGINSGSILFVPVGQDKLLHSAAATPLNTFDASASPGRHSSFVLEFYMWPGRVTG